MVLIAFVWDFLSLRFKTPEWIPPLTFAAEKYATLSVSPFSLPTFLLAIQNGLPSPE